MANTFRNYREGRGRDGKPGWDTTIGPGQPEHRQAAPKTTGAAGASPSSPLSQEDPEDSTLTAGKKRRYAQHYGIYRW